MYFYLLDVIYLGVVWFILYAKRHDIRKKMLFSSLLSLPLGFAEFLFVPYYWTPDVLVKIPFFNGFLDIESFGFNFAMGGIAAVLYEEMFHKRLHHLRQKRGTPPKNLRIFLIAIITPFLVLSFIMPRFSIYLGILWALLGTLLIYRVRKDLGSEIIWGGVLYMAVYILGFEILAIIGTITQPDWIIQTWNMQNISGIFIANVPIEEILYALSFGAVWAPLYEYVYGYTLHQPKSR